MRFACFKSGLRCEMEVEGRLLVENRQQPVLERVRATRGDTVLIGKHLLSACADGFGDTTSFKQTAVERGQGRDGEEAEEFLTFLRAAWKKNRRSVEAAHGLTDIHVPARKSTGKAVEWVPGVVALVRHRGPLPRQNDTGRQPRPPSQ